MRRDAVSRYAGALDGKIEPFKLSKPAAAVSQAIRSTPPLAKRHDLTASDGTQADEIRPESMIGLTDPDRPLFYFVEVPKGWIKGQLLNVRNNGSEYVVTVLGEEFDPRYPERAMRFDSSFTCQAFISSWYARETHDPRAF